MTQGTLDCILSTEGMPMTIKGFCKNLKCANAEKLEDLCPEHKAEYESYIDEQAERAEAQERYERDGDVA